MSARGHLRAASAGGGEAKVANEGDARIRAVRQRLLQAGVTHNTDESTNEDYMFIDSREKKALLDLASKVGRTAPDARADAIGDLAEELDSLINAAMADEPQGD